MKKVFEFIDLQINVLRLSLFSNVDPAEMVHFFHQSAFGNCVPGRSAQNKESRLAMFSSNYFKPSLKIHLYDFAQNLAFC